MERIKEKNLMLANFMGAKTTFGKTEIELKDGFLYLDGHGIVNTNKKDLRYHMSWDWLMGVVKKIFTLDVDESWIADIKDGLIEADIVKTYDSCFNFVEWYTSQNNLSEAI